jgi:hypothetical protein
MIVKTYLVYDVDPETGCDLKVVAVRLSMKSARAIAKLKSNRRVEPRVASKHEELVDEYALIRGRNERKADNGNSTKKSQQDAGVHLRAG